MRITTGGSISAMMLLLSAEPAVAETLAPGKGESVVQIGITRLDENFADFPTPRPYSGEGVAWDAAWGSWVRPEDLPESLRNRPLDTETVLAVDVDEQGKPAACATLRPSAEPQLDALACELIVKRGSFHPRFAGPAQPVPYRWVAAIWWQKVRTDALRTAISFATTPPPPPPPPPPGSLRSYSGWPRLNWADDVSFGPVPDIQPAKPGRGTGVVGLDLTVTPQEGVTGCDVGLSSGAAELDQAACRVARTIEMRYKRPCEFCFRTKVPLQIVWRKRGSTIRLPLPEAPKASAPETASGGPAYIAERRLVSPPLTRADFAKIADRQTRYRIFWANVGVDSNGKPIRCSPQATSDNPALDGRICAILVKRLRYTPRTDIFGDPVADVVTVYLDLSELL